MLEQHKTYQKVLFTLADGEFHSGEVLGQRLGLSRSAIWKAVAQLKNLGINVQSITRKGYRIQGGIDLLDYDLITQALSAKNKKQLNEIILLEKINSTNSFLLERIKQKPHKTIACFAEYQSDARGRRGNSWLSPFGNNIYHSLLWHFDRDPGQITGLSLAISIAIIRALIRYGLNPQDLQLKWPNDILNNGKKLGGILIEMHAESYGHCSVVIGIGLNTRMDHTQSEQLKNRCTSVNNITQEPVDRNQLAGYLLDELITLLLDYEQRGLKHFLEEWRQFDQHTGHPVKLLMANKCIEGIMHDITDDGKIIIKDSLGRLQHYCSGEVSLRLAKSEEIS